MPMSYPLRLRIAAENRKIARSGAYNCADGKTVTLPENGAALARKTLLLMPETLPDASRAVPFRISENLRACDTISAVLSLREEGVSGEIIALNFANAMFAGGGYRLGGDAQEESLCRCSLLYYALLPHGEYYWKHRLRPSPLYSSRMLLSPDVPVIRRMDGTLLETPQMCTFLTSAAVNRYYAKCLFIREKTITAAMQERIDGFICAMAKRKPAAVVLGAFGCGMFGNRRETVLPMIENAVNRWLPQETAVVYAAPSGKP